MINFACAFIIATAATFFLQKVGIDLWPSAGAGAFLFLLVRSNKDKPVITRDHYDGL